MKTIEQEDIKKLINNAMHELSKEDRKILYALYFNNISVHQLSKKLGISCSTIRYRKQRALQHLRGIVKENLYKERNKY